jgi:hypothetical protein
LKGFKKVSDEAKAMGKSIVDTFAAAEKAQKESLKRQAANAKREVQNFLNLGSGQGKGFGKTTGLGKAVLAQARKNQAAIKKAASMDLDALVKRGMEGTKRQQEQMLAARKSRVELIKKEDAFYKSLLNCRFDNAKLENLQAVKSHIESLIASRNITPDNKPKDYTMIANSIIT